MIIECQAMTGYRNTCNIGQYIAMYRRLQPQISSVKLYSLFLNDLVSSDLKEKILALYHMKNGWYTIMGMEL